MTKDVSEEQSNRTERIPCYGDLWTDWSFKWANLKGVVMDSLLIEGARELFADDLFDLVRRCYCESNKDYLQKQIQIASEYLTEDQKTELRQKGILV